MRPRRLCRAKVIKIAMLQVAHRFPFFFFFNDPPPPEFYPLPLHDPLPISVSFLYRTGVTVSPHRVSRARGTPGAPEKIGEGSATTLGRLEVLGQALAHEQPRAVHARLHRR